MHLVSTFYQKLDISPPQAPSPYDLGSTKVICNPHGYMNEPYNGFDKKLIIEI